MRRLVKWLTNILLAVLVLLVVIFVVMTAVFSSSLAVVYSGSMEPVMPRGALAWMEPVDPADIQVGDIIAFDPIWDDDDVTISHRVIDIIQTDNLSFQTKGDANEDADVDNVPAQNVLARVSFSIPRGGYVLNYVGQYTKSRLGFGLFIALPTVLLVGSAARDLNSALNPDKKRQMRRKKVIDRRKKWRKQHW